MSSTFLPSLPRVNLIFPALPLSAAAFAYTKQHTSEGMHNHTSRTAYWALIIAKKLPQFADVDLESVILSSILHDLGFAVTKELLTINHRFEVDGANIARAWLLKQTEQASGWDAHRTQLLWDTIALHTTPSIALHKQPEVALTAMAIMADFAGPNFSGGGVITREEYKEVLQLFPLVHWGEEALKEVMCGLCRDRPEATLDTFAAEFGQRFGYDGKGAGRDEYEQLMKKHSLADQFINNVRNLEEIDRQFKEEAQGAGK